jgi:hypothetical protein
MTDRASADYRLPASVPISIVSNESAIEDDDMSSLSSDEEPEMASPENPRSLFSNYWEKQGEAPSRKLFLTRSPSPRCVMNHTPDPYEHFGIVEEEEYSMNTYERLISHYEEVSKSSRRRPYETRPLWASWFSSSTPALPTTRCSGGLLASVTSRFQSEPTLRSKPLPSVLREGRFSKGVPAFKGSVSHNRRVRFQAKIMVLSYQPPAESWAADGWSSRFGV